MIEKTQNVCEQEHIIPTQTTNMNYNYLQWDKQKQRNCHVCYERKWRAVLCVC